MKRFFILCSFIFIGCFALGSLTIPNGSASTKYSVTMEKYLEDTVHYYNDDTMKTLAMTEVYGTVTKILRLDDPSTEENEERIEKYKSNLVIAFVEYEQVRDSIFFFTKKEFLYYDKDRNEFLLPGNVLGNKEVKEFFNKYLEDMGKEIQTPSLLKFMVSLFLALFIPVIILIMKEASHKESAFSIHQRQTQRNLKA
ncbi:hypothetical protein [Peribacillus alkalitolerans]|uniref:hypothetical protein n=1 Tax=Peribacillus alkalitolerans TaxID=1550385 RepID=UPI0013D3B120|nr:hypothetical protein [Peribacillus alkalitolerans]